MEGGGTGRPVSRTLCSRNRTPGKGCSTQPKLDRNLLRFRENQVAPAQHTGSRLRHRHGEQRKDEDLCIPEGMTVVAWPRQSLGRYRAALCPRSGLQNVEESKAHGLLNLRIPIHLNVSLRPKIIQIDPLLSQQALPASHPGCGESRNNLRFKGRSRTQARPTVGNELDYTQPLARLESSRDRDTGQIRSTFS